MLGEFSEPPESYWFPTLGNSYRGPGLRPSDLGDLTPAQLYAAAEFVRKNTED